MDLRLVYLDRVILFSLASFVVFSFFSISLTQISCGMGGLAWAVKCFLTRSWGSQKFPLKVPFLLFALACLIAVADAVDISESYKSLKRLLEILIFFWVVNCINDEGLKEKLILLLIVSATLSTLVPLYRVQNDLNIHLGTTGSFSRAEGTMSVYMTYAGLLMLSLLLAFSRWIFSPKENKWIIGAIILISVCLLFTYTRQAWLGLFLGLSFLIWVQNKKLFLYAPFLLVLIYFILPHHLQNRFSLTKLKYDDNLRIRMVLWNGGWRVFKDHPITGCGFKCIDVVAENYPDPTGEIKQLRGMHNNIVQIAVDTGLLGLISWLSIWVVFFLTLYRRLKLMEGNSNFRRDSLGSAAAIIAFLGGGFFETNFYDSEVSMLMYFIMALPFAANGKSPAASEKRNPETISQHI